MPTEEQFEDEPLVQRQLGEDPADGQPSGSSTVTSTSISSREENLDSSQQMGQQDEEMIEPPTTNGRINREVTYGEER